jgi:hypothetical protein
MLPDVDRNFSNTKQGLDRQSSAVEAESIYHEHWAVTAVQVRTTNQGLYFVCIRLKSPDWRDGASSECVRRHVSEVRLECLSSVNHMVAFLI